MMRIRFRNPPGVIASVWLEHNLARIRSFALFSPSWENIDKRNVRITIEFDPTEENLKIVLSEILRYAGVVEVVR